MKDSGNKRRQYQYTHTQVPFVTRKGAVTTCDEGMFDVLTLLREMGVETHFSCQGDEFAAYICSFTPGMRPVIAKTIELYSKGWLSEQSTQFVKEWRSGYRELCPMMGAGKRYFHINSKAKKKKQHFAHERELNGVYGDRTTIRWPKHRTHELEQLLIEIQPHI